MMAGCTWHQLSTAPSGRFWRRRLKPDGFLQWLEGLNPRALPASELQRRDKTGGCSRDVDMPKCRLTMPSSFIARIFLFCEFFFCMSTRRILMSTLNCIEFLHFLIAMLSTHANRTSGCATRFRNDMLSLEKRKL